MCRKVDLVKNVEKINEKVNSSGREGENQVAGVIFRSLGFVLALRVFLAVIRLTINRQCEVIQGWGGASWLEKRYRPARRIRVNVTRIARIHPSDASSRRVK